MKKRNRRANLLCSLRVLLRNSFLTYIIWCIIFVYMCMTKNAEFVISTNRASRMLLCHVIPAIGATHTRTDVYFLASELQCTLSWHLNVQLYFKTKQSTHFKFRYDIGKNPLFPEKTPQNTTVERNAEN